MDCRVVLEAAVPVYDVETADEAVRIAISKTGEMINPDLSYVEIEVGERTSPSGEALKPAFIVAGEALVALTFEMDVFNVDREQHALRIAQTEIGGRLHDIPLEMLEIEVLEHDESEDTAEDTASRDDEGDTGHGADEHDATDGNDAVDENDPTGVESDDILPSFEELLEE